jgi:hypothetical protein
MGPGARPTGSTSRDTPNSLAQAAEIRKSYTWERLPNGIKIGYDVHGQRQEHSYHFDNLPLGDLTQWILYGGPRRTNANLTLTIDLFRSIQDNIRRPLTQDEVNSIGRHSAMAGATNWAGIVSTFAAGPFFAYKTNHNMKFPFKAPVPIESYNAFPKARPILRGVQAQMLWQAWRYSIWTSVVAISTIPICGFIGTVFEFNGLARDPRSKEMMVEYKQALRAKNERRRQQQFGKTPQPAPGPRTVENSNQTANTGFENTSPTPDYAMYDQQPDTNDSQSSPHIQAAPQQTQQQQSRWPQRSSPTPARSQSARSKDDFFFNDSSDSTTDPNSPQYTPPSQPQQQSQPAGSVWARIRRQSSQSQSQQQEPLPSRLPRRAPAGGGEDSGGDSFSFSGSDSEKQYAKQQAQREFDEMLERERRESGSGEYARGMEAAQTGQESPSGGGSSPGGAWGRRRGQ